MQCCNLPFVRASLLEALANAYEASKRTSDAITAWSELYSFSSGTELAPATAEAALHLANLYAAQGDNDNAAKYSHLAAERCEASGNEAMLLQSLAVEAVSLAKTGRSAEALAADNQVVQLATNLKNHQ